MGYSITTLRNLPQHLGYYFFLIGDYRNESPMNDFFRNNFDQIADRLGEDAAIIKQTQKSKVEDELRAAILSRAFSSVTEISNLLDCFGFEYPGLLITKKHPSLLTQKDSMILIPFNTLEEVYKERSSDLLLDLVRLARGKNDLIKAVSKGRRIANKVKRGLGVNIGLFALNWPT